MQNCKWLSLLKLRVSYGTSGNIGTNDYRFYYATGYMFLGTPGVYISELANKNLKWEINKQLNVGIDAAFVNDRIRLTLDWYFVVKHIACHQNGVGRCELYKIC